VPRIARPVVLIPVLVAVVAATAAVAVPAYGRAPIALAGLSKSVFGAAGLARAEVSVRPDGHRTRLLIDGRPVATGSSGTLTAPLAGLPAGPHTITAEVDRGLLRGSSRTSRTITVDRTAPMLQVTAPTRAVGIRDAVTVSGTAERGAVVSAAGGQLVMTGTHFTVHYRTPPVGARVVATDAAGNAATALLTVPTAYPHNIRAVHMTGAAWAYDGLRLPVLQMIKEHRINAVQLDIKDEDGAVNYPSKVALAQQDGATATYYDASRVTSQLHALGVRVIGRIVAFNDPKLAAYAGAHGHRYWVIKQPDGSTYLYGYNKHGFTNFANSQVRGYNEDLAVEAVHDGFDDVVYDYVRRPDGALSGMRFPGLIGRPEDAIAGFLRETQARIRPLGGSLGAAAFAQASTRPDPTAQNIPKMARYLDVVIPMDYPSHWNPGEYGVPDTFLGAYDIVQRSLVDWQRAVRGTHCAVVPWLQDENYKGNYTAAKVMQQVQGARADGIPGWLMWSAGASYTSAAYSPDATPAR